MSETAAPRLSRKDFATDQEVRWCPGCGDYAILAQMQKVLPELGIPREKTVFISGIGCSSRFPYYMNCYGIHSIHGRAPTLATGLNLTDPELSIWVVTGDGDGLSIGANHLVHAIRRNINVNILLFNNRIYGLTKGQYSPTSLPGHRTKSSPMGSVEQSLNPIGVALAAEATFIARTVDIFAKHLGEVLKAAAAHKGTSFIEIYQNCIIFNDKAWEHVAAADQRENSVLYLRHGEPMLFGSERNRGIILDGLHPRVVDLGDKYSEKDLLIHDENDTTLAWLLSRMEPPEYPVPMGIFRQTVLPTFSDLVLSQRDRARERSGAGDLAKLYRAADTWEVAAPGAAAVVNGAVA